MFGAVYKCQFKLARYFQGTGDKWLADHFFHSCLATTASVKGDDGKMEAEGHCNVGLAKEESGVYYSHILTSKLTVTVFNISFTVIIKNLFHKEQKQDWLVCSNRILSNGILSDNMWQNNNKSG